MNSFSEKISRYLVNYPRLNIFIAIVLTLIFCLGLHKIKADFTYRIWLSPSDPLLTTFDEFVQTFGNDDSIVLMIHHPKGIFNPEAIKLVKAATEKMWLIPDIIRVDSLTNYSWTYSKDDNIIIEDFIQEDDNQNYLDQRKELAIKDKVLPGYLINHQADTTIIYAKVRPFLKGAPNDKQLIDETRKILADLSSYKGYQFFINGPNAITNTFAEVSAQDSQLMIPLVFVFIILSLWIFFKSLVCVLIPFIVIILTLLSTFGFAGMSGIVFNNIIFMVPFVIIAISIADTVHILVGYFRHRSSGLNSYEATYLSFKKNITPTFLTSISTSIGFLSFANAEIIPLAGFGTMSGVATILAWIYTLLAIAPILVLFPPKIKITSTSHLLSNLIDKTFSLVNKRPHRLVVLMILLFIGALYCGFQNEINSNTYQLFDHDVPIRKANDFGLEKIGGINGPQVIIDSGKVDGIKDLAFIQKLEKFQTWLEEDQRINKVISILDIIKKLNQNLNGGAEDQYILPTTSDHISQYLFLYSISVPPGKDLNDQISIDYQKTRMGIHWTIQETKDSLAKMKAIRDQAIALNLDIKITGKVAIYQGMNKALVKTFFQSISFALIGISILLIIFFKSFKIGALSMLPNIIPLGLGAGIMTIVGKPIDVGSALVTSVCLGIVVDDTIHFLSSFHHSIQSGMPRAQAVKHVMQHTGSALLTTSIILMAGFGILAFSNFIPNVNFGVFTTLIIAMALIVDLSFLPALLLMKKD